MNEINIGIDLGTTNSAIIGYDGEVFRVFKNKLQMEVTPSGVMIDKSGRIIVGRKAIESLPMHPNDVNIEFKRLMGTKESALFKSSGNSMSPEELSAEIIKSLLSDAQKFVESNIDYAVITIPAAFKALQCEATNKAAKLAALNDVALLMEPVAASIGFAGTQFDIDDKWMVYDLGGGTFDVAIVSHKNNSLSVDEHSGNNMLGGKNIDEKIIDLILLKRLSENYNLPIKESDTINYLNLRRRLKTFAESLKIDLSSSKEISVDIFDIGKDADGKEYDCSMTVKRDEIDKIAVPFIYQTIHHCNDVLSKNNLESNSLSKILLVGGPTQMPILRELLTEELNIPIDFSIDPMIAVAKGAALYCSTIDRSAKRISPQIKEDDKQIIQMDLSYQKISSVTDPLILGNIVSNLTDDKLEICFESNDGLWNSNWIPIKNGKFETNLYLKNNSLNSFTITLRNKLGKGLECDPENIVIRHGVDFDDFKLPYSISVAIRKSDGKEQLEPIFARNMPLPSKRTIRYAADKTLLPNSKDSIDIPIYEGEILDSPESNDLLFSLNIYGHEIQKPIPEGTPIDIIFSISNSRILNVKAYVELIDKEFDKRFVPDESQQNVTILHNQTIGQIDILFDDLKELEDTSSLSNEMDNIEILNIRDKADTIFIESNEISEIDLKTDSDRVKRIHEDVQRLNNQIYSLRSKMVTRTDQDINALLIKFNEITDEIKLLTENSDNNTLKSRFHKIYEDAKQCYEDDNIPGFKKCIDESDKIRWHLRMNDPKFLVDAFYYLESIKSTMKNQKEANRLLMIGSNHIEDNDLDGLRDIVWDLWDLLPDPNATYKAIQSGIRKL